MIQVLQEEQFLKLISFAFYFWAVLIIKLAETGGEEDEYLGGGCNNEMSFKSETSSIHK